MATFDPDVDRVRRATDMVELVNGYVPLRPSGRNFKGLCPFHEEKTPSFYVWPESQLFKCFGCNTAGDCYSFIMKRERLGFREALELLADRAGIELTKKAAHVESGPGKRALYECLDAAAKYFALLLERARPEFLEPLDRRGLHAEIRREWQLGLAPSGWQSLLEELRRRGVSDEAMVAAGLVQRAEGGRLYDRFRDRITFPIRDAVGRVIAFGARLLPGVKEGAEHGPKYLNSPEGELFSKRHILYGLDRLRGAHAALAAGSSVVVMEGYTDVILAHEAGMKTAVATLGTSLGPEHAKLLRRYSSKVLLLYDGDEAGLKASERGTGILLAEGLDVRIAELPDHLDPADYVLAHGGDAFLATVGAGVPLVQFLTSRISRRLPAGSTTAAERVRAADEVLQTIARVPSAPERSILIREVAAAFYLQETAVAQRVEDMLRQKTADQAFRRFAQGSQQPSEPTALEPLVGGRSVALGSESAAAPLDRRDRIAAEELLGGLLRDPSLLALVREARFQPSQISFLGYNQLLETALECSEQGLDADVQTVTLRLGASPLRDVPASLWASAPEDAERAVSKALAYFHRREAEKRIAAIKAELHRAEALGELSQASRLRTELLAWHRAYRRGAGNPAQGDPGEGAGSASHGVA